MKLILAFAIPLAAQVASEANASYKNPETRQAKAARAMAVCDNVTYFTGVVSKIVADLGETFGFSDALPIDVDDRAKGPAYGVATFEQRTLIVEIARRTGLLLDPVYTGKAFVGMAEAVRRGELGGRVLFLHTGGLPGLLADASAFSAEL